MPYPRLTLTQRIAQAIQDVIAAQIYDSSTGSVVDAELLDASPLRVIATVAAGAAYEEDGNIDWIALQANPWDATEDGSATPWAALKNVPRKAATAATTTRTLLGPVGTAIAVGTVFSRADGATYATLTDAAIGADGTATVRLQAQVAGAAGNAVAGTVLTPTLTIAGVSVQPGGPAIIGGADLEPFAAFKARYLAAYARPPQGGAAVDYVEWALAVAGVTRAWCLPVAYGANTVAVFTMWDDAEAAHGGFPQGTDGCATLEGRGAPATGEQLLVADAIYPLRPVGALVSSLAPQPYPVPFTIETRAVVPAAVQSLVLAALDAAFVALGDPLGGVQDVSPYETAVAGVSGMPRFTMTAPADEFAAPLGSLPVRGAVSWVVRNG